MKGLHHRNLNNVSNKLIRIEQKNNKNKSMTKKKCSNKKGCDWKPMRTEVNLSLMQTEPRGDKKLKKLKITKLQHKKEKVFKV